MTQNSLIVFLCSIVVSPTSWGTEREIE